MPGNKGLRWVGKDNYPPPPPLVGRRGLSDAVHVPQSRPLVFPYIVTRSSPPPLRTA